MVLVGLIPFLAIASSVHAAAIPLDSTPPASPALSLQNSATFSPIPSFSPQLNVPSPTLPSAITVPTPGQFDDSSLNHNSKYKSDHGINGNAKFDAAQNGSVTGNGNGNVRSGAGIGRGKGMTNAERMRRGLGILPPTRRMTSKPVRRSARPTTDTDSANQDATNSDGVTPTPNDGSVAETSTQPNDDNTSNTDSNNNDDDTANTGNGQVLASKKYSMRMMNPDDGSDMGLVTVPDNNDNPLVGYSPNPDTPVQMSMPVDPSSTPFTIAPSSSDSNGGGDHDGNGNGDGDNNDDDDSTFGGPRKVLAAVPHKTASNPTGDLGQGKGDYAPVGMGWTDGTGLLHLDLKALIHNPSTDTSNFPTDPTDLTNKFPTKQLLSRPGSGLPVDPTSGLPIDPSSGLPIDPSTLTSSDPTNLLHATVSNLPLGQDGFGDPQSTLWTFHPNSQRLLAHYINSDGNAVPTYFVTGGDCAHTICLTGDVEAFRNAQGSEAHEVHVLAEAVADL
ncbi:uncharacterized protein IL334_006936 [Kwoniella shivajii]|uniref:Uncharacterized protein n=1 Tax=Kwoniella shivajii TaxID=564305 RepID=A0ABZ1D7S2_9TREE|nr:hypothetical protein IL334_006936 [Kwoniella shivajii]